MHQSNRDPSIEPSIGDNHTDQPHLMLWQTGVRPKLIRGPWRQRLVTVGVMYLSFTMIGIAWNRFVDPSYDWTLVLVFVGILICFAWILQRQQWEMRQRLLRPNKK